MSETHEIIMPHRYEISAGLKTITDDGTEIWFLNYTEYHDKEDYFKAKPDSIETFKKIGWPMKFNDENFSASYNIQGPRDMVTNILASEFLGRSGLASLTLLDLLGMMVNQFANSGGKVAWAKTDEEP